MHRVRQSVYPPTDVTTSVQIGAEVKNRNASHAGGVHHGAPRRDRAEFSLISAVEQQLPIRLPSMYFGSSNEFPGGGAGGH